MRPTVSPTVCIYNSLHDATFSLISAGNQECMANGCNGHQLNGERETTPSCDCYDSATHRNTTTTEVSLYTLLYCTVLYRLCGKVTRFSVTFL